MVSVGLLGAYSARRMADDEGQDGGGDPRVEVLQQYTLKTMKLKNDKWAKV